MKDWNWTSPSMIIAYAIVALSVYWGTAKSDDGEYPYAHMPVAQDPYVWRIQLDDGSYAICTLGGITHENKELAGTPLDCIPESWINWASQCQGLESGLLLCKNDLTTNWIKSEE